MSTAPECGTACASVVSIPLCWEPSVISQYEIQFRSPHSGLDVGYAAKPETCLASVTAPD